MRTIFTVVSLIILQIFYNDLFAQKNTLEGSYIGKDYKGVLMKFNIDRSFTFRFKGHISSDTAAGKYSVVGDTIHLKYLYNNYEVIFAEYKRRNEQVPADITLSASRSKLRPLMLLRRNNKFYYLETKTKQTITSRRERRLKKVVLIRFT